MDHQLPELPGLAELMEATKSLDAPLRGVMLSLLGTVENFPYLGKAMSDDEMPEFLDGIRPLVHRFVDSTFVAIPDSEELLKTLAEFVNYIESWTLTARLSANSDWLRQMEESAVDDARDPVSVADLRARLAG